MNKLLFFHGFDDIQIKYPGYTHEPGLQQDNNQCAADEVVINTIIEIRDTEDRPVPAEIQKEYHYGERVVDTGAIVGLSYQLGPTLGTYTVHFKAIA